MCESSLMRGFERTRSPSTTVTATASRVTVLAVWEGRGLADGGGVDVVGGAGVAEGSRSRLPPGMTARREPVASKRPSYYILRTGRPGSAAR